MVVAGIVAMDTLRDLQEMFVAIVGIAGLTVGPGFLRKSKRGTRAFAPTRLEEVGR